MISTRGRLDKAWRMLMLFIFCGVVAFGQVPSLPYSYLAQPLNYQQGNVNLLFHYITWAEATYPWTAATYTWATSFVGAPNLSSYLALEQGTGNPSGANGTLLYVPTPQEAMRVMSFSGTTVTVQRGSQGTRQSAHGALARVWAAPSRFFWQRSPSGVCNPAKQTILPAVVIPSGQAFNCFGTGSWGSSLFSYNAAQFQWLAGDQGVWEPIPTEQGDWNVAALAWNVATFQWGQIVQ